MEISGNTVVITGGTSGIGLAFAKEFLKGGSKVIICGRRKDRLANIKLQYPEIITRICDVSNAEHRTDFAKWLLQYHPDMNILINNAGVQFLADLSKPVNIHRIHSEVETNFVAPLHLSSLLTGHLKDKKSSAIINISSGLAFVPLAFMPVYCATKAAIHSLTLSLRHQLRNTSIKVFEIAPPAVDTELGSDRRSDKTQTHGGMPVDEFIVEAMTAFKNDVLEAPIGTSINSREKREELFEVMNSKFN